MKIINILFLLTFCLLAKTSTACQCPLTKLGKAECNKYEIIFRGRVKSKTDCLDKKGEALFEILETQKILESRGQLTLVPPRNELLSQLLASNKNALT